MNQRQQQLERFYRGWLGRLREELPRHVPAERLASFQASLLKDLEPSAEGAALIPAVERLLVRLERLATSSVPGARYV